MFHTAIFVFLKLIYFLSCGLRSYGYYSLLLHSLLHFLALLKKIAIQIRGDLGKLITLVCVVAFNIIF